MDGILDLKKRLYDFIGIYKNQIFKNKAISVKIDFYLKVK